VNFNSLELVTFKGKEQSWIAWGKELNIPLKTLNTRRNRNWSVYRALNTKHKLKPTKEHLWGF